MSLDNESWWSEGLFFSCTQCGRCCRGEPGAVFFTAEEETVMARFLKLDIAEFRKLYVWKRYGKPSIRERQNYDCIFLEHLPDSQRCRIYDVRPLQCRTFPFWDDILGNELLWKRYSHSCPGINSGEFHSREEIQKFLPKN